MKASRNDLILTQLHCFCSCSRLCVYFGPSLSRVDSHRIFKFVLSDILGLVDFLFSLVATLFDSKGLPQSFLDRSAMIHCHNPPPFLPGVGTT
jgi:hypothetical protein